VEELAPLLFFAAIAAVFWLLVIRPNVRRQREQVAMQSSLQVGDQVMLTSGFYGTLRSLADDRVEVELAPGTTVTVARGAVGSVVPPVDVNDEADTHTDELRPSDAEEN
jgi:preprotein translocase subunit YajC